MLHLLTGVMVKMNLTITNEAAAFYKNEMELDNHVCLRLYVRVGGVGSGGFSVGVERLDVRPATWFTIEAGKLSFAIAEDDYWYFDGMTIDYNEDLEMVAFHQPKFDNLDHPLHV